MCDAITAERENNVSRYLQEKFLFFKVSRLSELKYSFIPKQQTHAKIRVCETNKR